MSDGDQKTAVGALVALNFSYRPGFYRLIAVGDLSRSFLSSRPLLAPSFLLPLIFPSGVEKGTSDPRADSRRIPRTGETFTSPSSRYFFPRVLGHPAGESRVLARPQLLSPLPLPTSLSLSLSFRRFLSHLSSRRRL